MQYSSCMAWWGLERFHSLYLLHSMLSNEPHEPKMLQTLITFKVQFSSIWRQSFWSKKREMRQNRHFWAISLENKHHGTFTVDVNLKVGRLWYYLAFLQKMFILIQFFIDPLRLIRYLTITNYSINIFDLKRIILRVWWKLLCLKIF